MVVVGSQHRKKLARRPGQRDACRVPDSAAQVGRQRRQEDERRRGSESGGGKEEDRRHRRSGEGSRRQCQGGPGSSAESRSGQEGRGRDDRSAEPGDCCRWSAGARADSRSTSKPVSRPTTIRPAADSRASSGTAGQGLFSSPPPPYQQQQQSQLQAPFPQSSDPYEQQQQPQQQQQQQQLQTPYPAPTTLPLRAPNPARLPTPGTPAGSTRHRLTKLPLPPRDSGPRLRRREPLHGEPELGGRACGHGRGRACDCDCECEAWCWCWEDCCGGEGLRLGRSGFGAGRLRRRALVLCRMRKYLPKASLRQVRKPRSSAPSAKK